MKTKAKIKSSSKSKEQEIASSIRELITAMKWDGMAITDDNGKFLRAKGKHQI